MEVVKKGLVIAVIRYAVLKFTSHWCLAHAELKLWNRALASFCFQQIYVFQVVTVFVETHFLLHISMQNWKFPQVFSNYVSNYVLSFSWIPQSYRPFSRWNMVFYVLSWRIFYYKFKNNECDRLHCFRTVLSHVHQYCCQISFLLAEYYWRYWASQLFRKPTFTGIFWPLLYFDAPYFILIG